jgi:DHA1 family multidrug resistance protein-like MFS transporter
MTKNLFYIYFALFLVFVGYGLTLPLLPFFVERLSSEYTLTRDAVSIHVGIITGIYALIQVLLAPLFGRLSDKIGRKPMLTIGLIGTAISIFIFGISTNLILLYLSRIFGGIFSAAVIPVTSAYVSDLSTIEKRGKVLAWLGGASSLGVTLGPAIASFLSNINIKTEYSVWYFTFDEFSIPFVLLSGLLIVSSILIKQLPAHSCSNFGSSNSNIREGINLLSIVRVLKLILILSFISQYSLMVFEASFSLHAKYLTNFGTFELGLIFSVCGGVMGISQSLFMGNLIVRKGENIIIPFGFLLTSLGFISLMLFHNFFLILLSVFIMSLGISAITPSVTSLVSKQFPNQAGSALGIQNSVDNLGKGIGAILGGGLFALNIHLPFLSVGFVLLVVSLSLFLKTPYQISLSNLSQKN